MYSVCKEMLDGMGLDQLAACAGFSESPVKNFLSYAYALSNRSFLFNQTCAMIIHLADMAVTNDADVAVSVKSLHKRVKHNSKNTDADPYLNFSGPVESHVRHDASIFTSPKSEPNRTYRGVI